MRYLLILLLMAPLTVIGQSTANWFEFKPGTAAPGNPLDMTSWIDKPAGKHGFLGMKGKDFVFEDGTPVKFWGVNICSDQPFAEEKKVKEWVKFMTHHGINGVRFHKFTWDATDGIHSTELTPPHWERFDRFCKELGDAGIYYSWSHIYGHRVRPADSSRLVAYAEIKDTRFPWAHLNGTTASLVNFAEDLQVLNIELTVNMLNHKNPLTGKRYADDPALTFVELQNEDNIFWAAIEETLRQTPTYKKMLNQKFSVWLRDKYKTQEALEKAWGGMGLEAGESLSAENIYPKPNHGLFSWEYEQALKENRSVPVHIADRAAFLFEEQMKFYSRFTKAIRDTGYKGLIIGSCWQAGSGITHFYNLYSDYVTGPIDRHNYFGGGTGHRLTTGKVDNQSMLTTPGSGLLSTGFQMVADRPFQISEWMSLIPTEWVAESAPLIATYGMGLQGWDASFSFAMDYPHYTPTIQSGHGVYNVTSPLQLALYPALAAMVYRNDVMEGKPVANRNVNIDELKLGRLNFIEKTAQQYDVKNFQSAVPAEALAIGPVTVSFNGKDGGKNESLDRYWDQKNKTITSTTGQLKWDYSNKGFYTVNTPGTKALTGFAAGTTHELGKFSITTNNEFAVIYLTSLDKNKDLEKCSQMLLSVMARARNTGMKYNEDKTALLEVGTAPILLEPVDVQLNLPKGKYKVHVLDHSGNKTGKTIDPSGNSFLASGTEYKAIYYLIERIR